MAEVEELCATLTVINRGPRHLLGHERGAEGARVAPDSFESSDGPVCKLNKGSTA